MMKYNKTDLEMEAIDKELKALNLIPLSVIMKSPQFGDFSLHKGVNTIELFSEWLNMRYKEVMKTKASFMISGRDCDSLFEWITAHSAVLGEVKNQFNACIDPSATTKPKIITINSDMDKWEALNGRRLSVGDAVEFLENSVHYDRVKKDEHAVVMAISLQKQEKSYGDIYITNVILSGFEDIVDGVRLSELKHVYNK